MGRLGAIRTLGPVLFVSLLRVNPGSSSRIVGRTHAIFSEMVRICLADRSSHGRVCALVERSTQCAGEELERDSPPGRYLLCSCPTNYCTGRPHKEAHRQTAGCILLAILGQLGAEEKTSLTPVMVQVVCFSPCHPRLPECAEPTECLSA